MSDNYKIVCSPKDSYSIGMDGNMISEKDDNNYYLENANGKKVSNNYYCIFDLGNDHFAVCNPVVNIFFYYDTDYYMNHFYDIKNNDYDITNSSLKWGIIRIKRDKQGYIISKEETLVIPYVYDVIEPNTLKTATVWCYNKASYINLDIDSKDYGKQIVPCIFDKASNFDSVYEGYAKCSIGLAIGYLPRNCIARTTFNENDLLREEHMWEMSRYLEGSKKAVIDEELESLYLNLTGEELLSMKGNKILKKAMSLKMGI